MHSAGSLVMNVSLINICVWQLLREEWSDEEVLQFIVSVFKGLAILNISKRDFYRIGSPIEKSLSAAHTFLLLILAVPLTL